MADRGTDRTFYGGDSPNDVLGGVGEVGGPRHYTGDRPSDGPWKCPACKADQTGPLAEGCQACGSGTQKGYHITSDGPPRRLPNPVQAAPPLRAKQIEQLRTDMADGLTIYQYALNWSAANPEASLADAFIAGYQYANAKTIGAPPVAVDVPTLAPEGKPRRTIVAALGFFREQILPRALDEVASGEWCSVEEVDELIRQLQAEEERGR